MKLPKISRRMLGNLRLIGDGWTRVFYHSQLEPLVKRGLIEMEYREYQPPPRLEPHGRLTALGRALLGSNDIEEHIEK